MKANDVWEELYNAAVLETDSEKLPKLFFIDGPARLDAKSQAGQGIPAQPPTIL